jgi:hypothetical protein
VQPPVLIIFYNLRDTQLLYSLYDSNESQTLFGLTVYLFFVFINKSRKQNLSFFFLLNSISMRNYKFFNEHKNSYENLSYKFTKNINYFVFKRPSPRNRSLYLHKRCILYFSIVAFWQWWR